MFVENGVEVDEIIECEAKSPLVHLKQVSCVCMLHAVLSKHINTKETMEMYLS